MIETKVLRVENTESAINSVGRTRGCFGWTVTNVQVTHSENTKTYSSAWDQIGGNQTQTVETNIVDYATITLQRDTALEHYMDLVDLEEEYDHLAEQAEDFRTAVEKNEQSEFWTNLFLNGPVGRIIANKIRKGKREEAAVAETELNQINSRMQEILRQARSLLR